MKNGATPWLGLFYRSLIAVPVQVILVTMIFGFSRFRVYFSPYTLFLVVTTSALIVFGDALYLYSLKHYSVNQIMPVASTYPLVTIGILLITGAEKIGLVVIVGAIIIVVGVAAISTGSGLGKLAVRPTLISLLVASFWGSSIFLVRLILTFKGVDAFSLTGIRILFIGLGGLLVHQFSRDRTKKPESRRKALLYLGLSGFIGWSIGASAFFFAVQKGGAAITTPISSTNPMVAGVIGLIFGWEGMNMRQFLGIVLCVAGTIILSI